MARLRLPEPPKHRPNDEARLHDRAVDTWVSPEHLAALSQTDASTWAARCRARAIAEHGLAHRLSDAELRHRFGAFQVAPLRDRAQVLRINRVILTADEREAGAATVRRRHVRLVTS